MDPNPDFFIRERRSDSEKNRVRDILWVFVCIARETATRSGHRFSMSVVYGRSQPCLLSREHIRLARLEDTITLVEIPVEINIMETEDAAAGIVSNRISADEAKLRRQSDEHEMQRDGLVSTLPKIDFLLIDHDKDAYHPDLIRLEREGLVTRGSSDPRSPDWSKVTSRRPFKSANGRLGASHQ